MMVDMTNRLDEEETHFLERLRAGPPEILYFAPGKEEALVAEEILAPEEFIQLLNAGK
jgi:hypothetical protein